MMHKHLTGGLEKWASRPEWQDNFAEFFELHLGPVCEQFDLGEDEFFNLFPESFDAVLMGYVFEDLVTATFPDGRNLADEYLKRRGWKEKAAARNYIRALKESHVSIYEISDIKKDIGFFARDILGDAEPVWVSEKSGTHFLFSWDKVAVRLLNVNGKTQFSGGILRLDQEMVDEILETVNLLSNVGNARLLKALEELKQGPDVPELSAAIAQLRNRDGELTSADEMRRSLAVLCCNVYLQHTVSRILDPDLPTLVNTDGDPIEWHEVRFPLPKGMTQAKIRPDICAMPGLQAENGKFWNWLELAETARQSKSDDRNIRIVSTTMNTGETVLGNVELKGRDLILTTNSAARAERGAEMIATALAGKVGEPVIQIVEPDEENHLSEEKGAALHDDPEFHEVQIEMINQYYRQLIDEPVPALGQKSPRELSKSGDKKKIEELVKWVKLIENHISSSPSGSPLKEIDVSWMWNELGVSPR